MPLRSPKMYFCILGFQRLVWWPKCTPASSSSFMVSAAISVSSSVGLRSRAAGIQPALTSPCPGPLGARSRLSSNCRGRRTSPIQPSPRRARPLSGLGHVSARTAAGDRSSRSCVVNYLLLGRVLAVDPNVLLAEIRCPHPVLAAAEAQVYADRILGLRHERADLVEPRTRLERALLHH